MVRDKPAEVRLQQDADIEVLGELPLVLYSVTAVQDGNGPGLYTADLDLTFLVEGDGFEIVSAFYDLVHAWDDNNTGFLAPVGYNLPNLGWVNSLLRETGISRTNQLEVPSRTVTQYAGSFTLALRK